MKIRKFDTKVQHLKYKVLREMLKEAWNGTLLENLNEIPKRIVKGKEPTLRCCIYKERAIVQERMKMALGGNKENPNVIEVIDIACDECPESGYEVTESCRGCLAHRCEDVCKLNAITFDENLKARIDKSKCVNCGACSRVCPYSAIINRKRPCEVACKIKAIKKSKKDDSKAAEIDNSKCTSCGACGYQCPFGAIVEKSFVLDVVNMLKNEDKVYAVVAPSIAGQFKYIKFGQVLSGIKELGFNKIIEAALGADMVAYNESKELAETDKAFLTSSCCPAFVDYIEKFFPNLKEHISHNLSPVATVAKYIKEKEPDCKIVFIGPCTAKKMEFQKENVKPYIDSVITFEELQALFDSREIPLGELPEDTIENASYFGRIFARSGGITDAVAQGLKEHGYTDFDYKPITCNGIEECKRALLKASKGVLPNNFIEGMACTGGCVGGAGCLTHTENNRADVDKHGEEAIDKTLKQSMSAII